MTHKLGHFLFKGLFIFETSLNSEESGNDANSLESG